MRMMSGKRYYGEDCDVSDVEEARQFRELIKDLVALGGASNLGDFLAFLRWFDYNDLKKKLRKMGKRTDAFMQGLIDEHRNKKRERQYYDRPSFNTTTVTTRILHGRNHQRTCPGNFLILCIIWGCLKE